MTRIGIAGPSGMLRSGLEALLRANPDVEIVYTVDSLEEAEEPGQGSPGVVIALDADLDAISAPGLPPLIVITAQATAPEFVRAALRAGVRSVLPHACTSTELYAAIDAAAAGLITLRPGEVESVLVAKDEPARSPSLSTLTPRETEVLRLLADGLANKEIAYRLAVSEHTVKFHVNSILTRLDASSRAEAVAIGIRQGLILL